MKDELFSTQDIPQIAYLLARGHKILQQTKTDNFNRVTFTFQKSDALLEDLFDYGNDTKMGVQTFYRNLSFVWSLIKQEKRENGKNS